MLPFENCPDLLFYPFSVDPQANMYRVRPYKPEDRVIFWSVVSHTDSSMALLWVPLHCCGY